jgi:hypothetical protein
MAAAGRIPYPAPIALRDGRTVANTGAMTRIRLIWIAAFVLAAVTLTGAILSAFGPERIALTGADLQERINRGLPRQFHNVTVERASVSLADGRISVRAETRASALGKTIATAVVARGVPQYNAERGEVFFDADDVRLEDSGNGGLVKQLGLRIGGRLGEQIEQNLPRVEGAAASLVASGIKGWLAVRPVYRFKDDIKGLVFKATLKDIAVEGDTLVIGLSLIRLSAAVAAWLSGLALVMLGGILLWRAQRRTTLGRVDDLALSHQQEP